MDIFPWLQYMIGCVWLVSIAYLGFLDHKKEEKLKCRWLYAVISIIAVIAYALVGVLQK
jgi:quinol-cytochrome oxidoreductase complex cytochrome b subunit